MNTALVFGLLKVAIETFHDERRDRFMRKYVDLENEFNKEMAKPKFNPGLYYDNEGKLIKEYDARDFRSDLSIAEIMLKCESLAKLVISERAKNK